MAPARSAKSAVTALTCAILAIAAAGVLVEIHAFGQSRFLTIDEFQWGHATWLVGQGQIPYRDFYEHHLPLGYALHAPWLDAEDGFVANTLRLRNIAFFYMLGALGLLAWATQRASRSWPQVLLLISVVPSIGFGLMSAIEYRGDNWAAFTLIASLSLIEIGALSRSRRASALAGVLFAMAIGMTQKIVLLGGGAIAVLLLGGWLARSDRAREGVGAFRMESPGWFLAGATSVAIGAVLAGLGLGIVGRAFEINVLDSLRHEQLYPGFGVGLYLRPYLTETAFSSLALGACVVAYVAGGRQRFWTLPLAAAALGGALIKAPFPYNFVLVTWLLGVCAVRGWGDVVGRLVGRADPESRVSALLPLLYLLPLAIVPAQLGFVSGTSTLDDQLRLLEKVERHTGAEDVVIDSAGSALFRPNRGYHWYHGRAHVQMFADWFDEQLVPAMRASQAPLWIRTVRFDLLPAHAQRYLLSHYVPFHGDLNVLGVATRSTGPGEQRVGRFEVVRSGRYWVSRLDGGNAPPGRLRIDGEPVDGAFVDLEIGLHDLELPADTPALRISYLPPDAFGPPAGPRPHTPLFEYRRARRPSGRASR